MPYAQLDSLPETTELSAKALKIAKNQNQDLFRSYLRRLRIAALGEARNIEDRELLIKLAGDAGFNTRRFEEIWAATETDPIVEYDETPLLDGTVGDFELSWSGDLSHSRTSAVFRDIGVHPIGTVPDVSEFVAEYEPVAPEEITSIYSADTCNSSTDIKRTVIGAGRFWITI